MFGLLNEQLPVKCLSIKEKDFDNRYYEDRLASLSMQLDAQKNLSDLYNDKIDELYFWNKFWKAFACVMMLCATLLLIL